MIYNTFKCHRKITCLFQVLDSNPVVKCSYSQLLPMCSAAGHHAIENDLIAVVNTQILRFLKGTFAAG